jgi:uncharacterized protein YcgI (DUF1989 family)
VLSWEEIQTQHTNCKSKVISHRGIKLVEHSDNKTIVVVAMAKSTDQRHNGFVTYCDYKTHELLFRHHARGERRREGNVSLIGKNEETE